MGPEYKISLQFPAEYLQPALIVDSLNSSHPMSAPEDTNDVFDEIEYDKGASVLRMCQDFLGAETFRRGLHRYLSAQYSLFIESLIKTLKMSLTNSAFSNTVEADLWHSFNEQVTEDGVYLPAKLDVIMQTWTQQTNYPLVTIIRNYDSADTVVKQVLLTHQTSVIESYRRFVRNASFSMKTVNLSLKLNKNTCGGYL